MNSRRRSRLTEADRAAWASYTSRTVPLPGRQTPILLAEVLPPEKQTSAPTPRPSIGGNLHSVHPAPSPLIVGTQPGGVDGATWRRFRAGRLPREKVLDLHGQTAQRAYHALVGFLNAAHADRVRCVEVVTGRGGLEGGVLRRELPHWLNLPELRPLVLAAAHPHVANPGSVRLLLRRLR
jgi:DNA-nicking Smr family endonuclease